MNQVERLYKIDQLLRKAPHSLQQLTELLEVSVATIKRDIEYMRDRLCAPIISDRSSHAYRLDMNAQHADRYVLPGLWFSEAEIRALLTLQHLISQLEPSNILEPHIKPFSKRLDTLLSHADQPVEKIRERMLITELGKRSLKTSCLPFNGPHCVSPRLAHVGSQMNTGMNNSEANLMTRAITYCRFRTAIIVN
jgi:biotin operon repressor